MEATRVTGNVNANSQLCYFTSSSLLKDDKTLIFISDETGDPNIFRRDLVSGEEQQLSRNTEGTLKSYVYFSGNENRGLGKASISVDANHDRVYYIQGRDICCVDMDGNIRVLNKVPENQVTAFTHVSADGKRLCVPTTDARALEDKSGRGIGQLGKKDVINDKPSYNVDERVQNENLSSYIRVYDTVSGEEILCEKVERAWITHVQFSPVDSNIILYNHEWPADCGIRRMWIWDGQKHIRLRNEDGIISREDWTCHEMWQADGQYIIYHGKFKDERPYIGRVGTQGIDNIEISFPEEYQRYGHFTAGNVHNNWLVCDGYFHPEGEPTDEKGGGEWLSLQKVDWEKRTIEWVPLCKHHSLWDSQDSHPHPILSHKDDAVYFTSNMDGKRAVYKVEI